MPTIKNRQGFLDLYERHKGLAANVIYNITGADHLEDLVQETFIRVWKGLPAFSFKSSHKTWIYRIATNVAIDHCRKAGFGSPEIETEIGRSLESSVSNGELTKLALTALNPNERASITLAVFEGLSFKEMSEVLGEPEGTLKARVSKAKKKMKEYLMSHGVEL